MGEFILRQFFDVKAVPAGNHRKTARKPQRQREPLQDPPRIPPKSLNLKEGILLKAQGRRKGGALLLVGALLVIAAVAVFTGCSSSDNDAKTTVYESNQQYNYYALFVGIAKYPSCVGPLTYTSKDADDMSGALVNSTHWGNMAARMTIKDDQATKENIRNFVQLYKEKGNTDTTFFMSFSGHGTNQMGEHAAIVVYKPEEADYITDTELTSWLTGSPCNAVIYLDSCFSGGFINRADSENKVKVYTGAEGFDPNYNKGWQIDSDKTRGLDDLERIVAVTGTTGEEVGWEVGSLKNGLFTYYLLQGLGRSPYSLGPAEVNNDGFITAQETFNYLQPRVITYSTDNLSSVQTPQMVDNYAGGLVIK